MMENKQNNKKKKEGSTKHIQAEIISIKSHNHRFTIV